MIAKLLTILLCLMASSAHAQNWEWANVGNDSGLGRVQLGCIAIDSDGNTFVTGEFYDTLTIDTFNLVSHGFRDVFWAKFDANGKCVWAKSTGGKGDDDPGGIAVNSQGEVFVFLSFADTISDGQFQVADTGFGSDLLLAKYDNNGVLIDYKTWASRGHEIAASICTDKYDNLYLLGSYCGLNSWPSSPVTIQFDSFTLYSVKGGDIFIVKVDSLLSTIWAKSANNNGGGGFGSKVYVDDNMNIVISGISGGVMNFDTVHLTSPYSFSYVFVAKYDSAGNALWARAGSFTQLGNFYTCCVTGKDGSVYCTGVYNAGGGQGGSSIYFESVFLYGDYAFLVKYSATGQLLWAKNLGTTDGDAGADIAIDSSDNLYVTGTFNYWAVFGTDSFVSVGHDDIFVNKYDSNGNHLWTVTAGGQTNDGGYAITLDKEQNVYIGGYISSRPAYFGSHQMSASYAWDMCVAKLNPMLPNGINEISPMVAATQSCIYPNPNNGTFTINPHGVSYETVSITDLTGKTIYTQTLSTSNPQTLQTQLPQGMYFIKLQGAKGTWTEKMIVER